VGWQVGTSGRVAGGGQPAILLPGWQDGAGAELGAEVEVGAGVLAIILVKLPRGEIEFEEEFDDEPEEPEKPLEKKLAIAEPSPVAVLVVELAVELLPGATMVTKVVFWMVLVSWLLASRLVTLMWAWPVGKVPGMTIEVCVPVALGTMGMQGILVESEHKSMRTDGTLAEVA
jgi:hypothetical protein